MALFGKSNEEKAQEVEIEIRTDNSWLGQSVPRCIVRQIVNHGMEKLKNGGCYPVSPYIRMHDCLRIVETDQTFVIETRKEGLKVVPKCQVIEVQYF